MRDLRNNAAGLLPGEGIVLVLAGPGEEPPTVSLGGLHLEPVTTTAPVGVVCLGVIRSCTPAATDSNTSVCAA